MSILGYSAAYFLPEYWSNTPLYGEKIIPLLDYILSTDYVHADKLANAFHVMENKYKNPADLPIEAIEALIEESGYSYVKDLLGDNEESIRLLVYLLVLIHQLKGTKLGIEVVLNLLKRDTNAMVLSVIGNPTISSARDVTDFSIVDYVFYNGFTTDEESFEVTFQIRTPSLFSGTQCIASVNNFGFYIGINSAGKLVLSLGSKARDSWDVVDGAQSIAALAVNNGYYLKLTYDGFEYALKVSRDNVKYTDYIVVKNPTPTNIHRGIIYLGVDHSTQTPKDPFGGYINLTPFTMDVQNVSIIEWFDQFPVADENTFIIKADLDLGVVNTDFFANFATFVRKYVYPTLNAFEAKLNFESNLTLLLHSRQNITYIASSDVS